MALTMMPMMGATVYADDQASAAPGIVLGADVLGIGSNTSGAATVHMADKAWRVIGYDGSGVASRADTMTLISDRNVKINVEFRAERGASDADHYSKSNLKTEVDAVADTFSDGEKAGIAARDLASGSYSGEETDCIAGDEVKDALLWPLSSKEARAMNGALRRLDEGTYRDWAMDYWWLRSPGIFVYGAAHVWGDGRVDDIGQYVDNIYGVRPAFNYDLRSVIFTSAAEGGKSSGTVGADSLTQIGDNTSNEWKLTVKNGHDSFAVDSVSLPCSSEELSVSYSGAITGDNEYISAIIKDKDGNVKYYGNLKSCAEDSDASDTIGINVDGKLGTEDTLYVFNEQLNGDKKTDFASELKEITVPQTISHSMTHHDAVSPTCTEDGTIEYWSCEDCNKDFGDDQGTTELTDVVVPKTGHKYGAWENLDETLHQRVCENDAAHVEKENHSWDAGEVTKPATEQAEGVKTFTCTICNAAKTETIPKLKPSAPKVSGTLLDKLTAKSKSITITWNKVRGAEGYDVFFAQCNSGNRKVACKKVKTVKGNKTFKWTKSGLKEGASYKAYVKAYVMKDGKKKYVKTGPMMHAYTGNGTKKYTNAKSVTVNKAKVTLKEGKTFIIKAKVSKVKKDKKLMPKSHVPTVRYKTSNSKVATVSKAGKITAKGKGTCCIYAYAHNGVSKQVKVTVK